MSEIAIKQYIDFNMYPSVGKDDWRYAFASARVSALETQLLTHATLLDMANAADFTQALEVLSSTEYSLQAGEDNISAVEEMLLVKRSEVRALFKGLMLDEPLVELLWERDDFANLRLAVRRKLTDREIGTDYSSEGSINVELFEEVFREENYSPLPNFMQEAVEVAVLAYYENKNIRDIDIAIDRFQAQHRIAQACKLKSKFLEGLFRIQIDLNNIGTMLRLKFAESELHYVFIDNGFVDTSKFKHSLALGYEAISPLFDSTPYSEIIESSVRYLLKENSFLKLESNCDHHLRGYLDETKRITAGPQPVIAFLMKKEAEIRNLRLILAGKKNNLDSKLLLDRLGE